MKRAVRDLGTHDMRRIAPDVTLPPLNWTFPLSATLDEAYFDLPAGDEKPAAGVANFLQRGVHCRFALVVEPFLHDALGGVDADDKRYRAGAALRFSRSRTTAS